MMKHISVLVMILALGAPVFGATPNAKPTATPVTETPAKIKDRNRGQGWQFGTGLAELVKNGKIDAKSIRRSAKKERELIAIHPQDKAKYDRFSKLSNVGFTRLYDVETCARSTCPIFIPGRASAYSFRNTSYRSQALSELVYEDGSFKLRGINTLGFLTELGKEQIEDLGLGSPGILEMAKFKPSSYMSVVEKQYLVARNGFQIGEHIYKTELSIKAGTTYALRSIAYKADLPKEIKGIHRKILLRDKKKDTLVVFKVIRKHDNGSVSLLWRVLASKESPKLGFREPTKPKLKKTN